VIGHLPAFGPGVISTRSAVGAVVGQADHPGAAVAWTGGRSTFFFGEIRVQHIEP
jgi:hypothetical protein